MIAKTKARIGLRGRGGGAMTPPETALSSMLVSSGMKFLLLDRGLMHVVGD